jgi:hypothetical protein
MYPKNYMCKSPKYSKDDIIELNINPKLKRKIIKFYYVFHYNVEDFEYEYLTSVLENDRPPMTIGENMINNYYTKIN